MSETIYARQVERWGIFEVSLKGPDEGNPFLDVKFGAQFKQGRRILNSAGFYDGHGQKDWKPKGKTHFP